jgi:2-oxoglutarate ferredoxin oxidoreductase subunit delta
MVVTNEKKKVRGSVVILAERCKGCGFCVEFCPPDALKLSEQYNQKGYHPPILISEELCNGCNICGLMCPDFAIYGFIYMKKKPLGNNPAGKRKDEG